MRWTVLVALAALTAGAARAGGSVVVLPFFNLTGNSSLDWIGESIAETVRESLAAQGQLVLDRGDREEALRRLSIRPQARLTQATVVKIGQTLDAANVVYGQFELTSKAATLGQSTLRVSGRILDLRNLRRSPELIELAALNDLSPVSTRFAWQTLRRITADPVPGEEEFVRANPPLRIDAMENYIRGLLAPTADQKRKLFTQAARLDARFSRPALELGRMAVDDQDYRGAIPWLERVLRTNSHFNEAQFLLGLARYHTGDFAAAEAAFQGVAKEVPLNEVWNNLGAAMSRRNLPAAADSFARAIEGDSADPDFHFNLGYSLWKRGKFEAAAASFRSALDRRPDDPDATVLLGRCLAKTGPRPGDPRSDGLERLKIEYEEAAYRQLMAEIKAKK